ncbi:hypothetical protein, partial [Streptomyces boluensis]
AEYVDTLRVERLGYAWVMRHHGGRTPERAWAEALEHYPYEPPGTPCRGLVFHDEAWHWAMLTLHGHGYWQERPALREPSAEYCAIE